MPIISQNYNILDKLYESAYKNNRLFMCEIDVTNQCNAKCFFCYQGKSHKKYSYEMTFEEILNILKDLRKLGCLFLSFSGGEPFCRKDFIKILEESKKLGFIITFVTNLHVIDNDSLARLPAIGIHKIIVSFHSIKPGEYASIFGVNEELYWSSLTKLRYLISKKVNLGISVTVSNRNAHELEDIKEFFVNEGIASENIRFNTMLQGKSDIIPSRGLDKIENILSCYPNLTQNILSKLRIKSDSFTCAAGKISCVIRPNGDVLPCGFMNCSAGNVLDSSLLEIWRYSNCLHLVRCLKPEFFPKCYNCEYIDLCSVCVASNMNETGNPVLPSDNYCELRKNIIEYYRSGVE